MEEDGEWGAVLVIAGSEQDVSDQNADFLFRICSSFNKTELYFV